MFQRGFGFWAKGSTAKHVLQSGRRAPQQTQAPKIGFRKGLGLAATCQHGDVHLAAGYDHS